MCFYPRAAGLRPAMHVVGYDPFDFLKAHRDPGLFVGVPIRNNANGNWTVYFGRRIESRAGVFLGIVTVGVSPAFFLGISDGASAIEGLYARLLREDGTIYVTNPQEENRPGEKTLQEKEWLDLVAQGGGTFRTVSSTTGVARFMAVKPVADYPLVVDVGRSESSVREVWRARVVPIAAVSFLLALLMAILTGFLLVQFNRALERQAQLRERDERLVHASKEREVATARFEAALTHMRQGLAVFDRGQPARHLQRDLPDDVPHSSRAGPTRDAVRHDPRAPGRERRLCRRRSGALCPASPEPRRGQARRFHPDRATQGRPVHHVVQAAHAGRRLADHPGGCDRARDGGGAPQVPRKPRPAHRARQPLAPDRQARRSPSGRRDATASSGC